MHHTANFWSGFPPLGDAQSGTGEPQVRRLKGGVRPFGSRVQLFLFFFDFFSASIASRFLVTFFFFLLRQSCVHNARTHSAYTHVHWRALAASVVRVRDLFLALGVGTLLRTPAEPRPAPPLEADRDLPRYFRSSPRGGRAGKMKSDSRSPSGSLPPTLNKMPAETQNTCRTPATTHARAVQHSCGARSNACCMKHFLSRLLMNSTIIHRFHDQS